MAQVEGTNNFRAALQHGMQKTREGLTAYLDALGEQMTGEMKQSAPRKTGALANSVRHGVTATPRGVHLAMMIGDEKVFYAPHVEYGHAGVPAHPFARPVMMRNQAGVIGAVEAHIMQVWDRS